MGVTRLVTTITNTTAPTKICKAVFSVSVHATDSMAPLDELEKIGVRPEGKTAYELANGEVREYSYGLARIEFIGEITAGRVIFGEPGREPVLGVTALESVGIMVDPANKTLVRLPVIPLKTMVDDAGRFVLNRTVGVARHNPMYRCKT